MLASQYEIIADQPELIQEKPPRKRSPLTVAMVVYAFYESDTRVMQYAEALAERGDSVEILALRRDTSLPKVEVIRGVTVYRLQERALDEKGPASYLKRILQFALRSSMFLYRRQKQRPYDLIHVHNVPDFLVFSALPARKKGAPIILDIHDLLPELYASKFGIKPGSMIYKALLWVERLSARYATHVIVANHIWCNRLADRSSSPLKCSVIRNRPDTRIFQRSITAPSHQTPKRFLLTYPGSLNTHQGVDVAIRAFARVAFLMPDADFHIYGEGAAKPSLIALASERGMEGRILFHPYVPTQKVAQIMEHTDLAIEPKRSQSAFGNEALSTKLLEFMTMGVPIIASRTAIHALYYDDSIVQYYDHDDEHALAYQMLRLWRDRSLRESLAQRALAFARNNTWDARKHEYCDLVDSLVDARVRPGKEGRSA
jgi:glycosyltransferase involved in cell wall biosynthesis